CARSLYDYYDYW
nr:immunoglobulin heavy chain junction region [Mus musculus]